MNRCRDYVLRAPKLEAFQWSGDRFADDLPPWAWLELEGGRLSILSGQSGMLVRDKFGVVVVAMAGDFIIRAGDDIARIDERTFKRLFEERAQAGEP